MGSHPSAPLVGEAHRPTEAAGAELTAPERDELQVTTLLNLCQVSRWKLTPHMQGCGKGNPRTCHILPLCVPSFSPPLTPNSITDYLSGVSMGWNEKDELTWKENQAHWIKAIHLDLSH